MTSHLPVLLPEVLRALELRPGLAVVDGTVGAAGHSREILKRIEPEGRLLGLDRDATMLARAAGRVGGPSVHLVQASYAEMRRVLDDLGWDAVDRVLVDLGLSSDQLAEAERGFGFTSDSPLDMRFDTRSGASAAEWLAAASEAELRRVLEDYGEEPHARRIAEHLVARRGGGLRTGRELAEAVAAALPAAVVQAAKKDVATRVFQALRIQVNGELEHLERLLDETLPACLRPGGIAAVISFHSLEDRRVKQAFKLASRWDVLTAKPITARPAEARINPRSRSAKLRAARLR